MIYLFTDFGYQGPYVGELKAALDVGTYPGIPVIDLMHDAPMFNPEASAYLLAALSQRFQSGDACLGIIDPGVGSEKRLPIIVEADGVTYSGPDNGLFSQVITKAKTVVVNEITWRPEQISNSFHGRDLFAPALLKFLRKDDLALRQIAQQNVVGVDWPSDLNKVIYIDGFGNLVTSCRSGSVSKEQSIVLADQRIGYAETFSSQAKGQPFWYINSMGLVEIALNQQRADEYFQINIGALLSVVG